MAVHTGDLRGMNRLGPHHDLRHGNMALQAYTRVGHQKLPCRNHDGNPDDEYPWKHTEKEPLLLDKVEDELLQKIEGFHRHNPLSSIVRMFQ